MRLARLLPLFVVLLIVSCFSAQAQQPPVLTHEDEQAGDVGAPGGAAQRERIDARLLANTDDKEPPSPEQVGALDEMSRRVDGRVRADFNPLNGTLRLLFARGSFLSEPSVDPPRTVAGDFLLDQADLFALSPEFASGLIESRVFKNENSGITHVQYEQQYEGLKVFQSTVRIAVTAEGRVLTVTADYYPELSLPNTDPALSKEQAMDAAFGEVGPPLDLPPLESDPDPLTASVRDFYVPTAELVVFPLPHKSAALAWRVGVPQFVDFWDVVVDANSGAVLYVANLTNDDAEGQVFLEHPDAGSQVTVPFVGPLLSPRDAWVGANSYVSCSTCTSGNNAIAYEDRNSDFDGLLADDPQAHFNFGFANSYEATGNPDDDQDTSITNLFYLVNVSHDHFYQLGFTEAAGNFQDDNFGAGGLGSDPVFATTYTGWDSCLFLPEFNCRNNAWFFTTPEGNAPLMQTFLFTSPPLERRDPSLDGDIVIHEYSHGVSNRLVGVGTLDGVQSGAMGEGWSDYFPISLYDDPVMGEYGTGNAATGIRRYAYDNSPLTYGDLCTGSYGCEVHDDGEIWAVALWDLRQFYVSQLGLGAGQEAADGLVMEGLMLTPPYPSMLDGRDAILQAELALGGTNQCAVWQVFADRGMGYSATSAGDIEVVTEAFDLPSACDSDGDDVWDGADNCPDDYNPGQEDNESDGIGDVCDDDDDNDTVLDVDDNCPDDYNPGQEDFEPDGIGDACDNCPFTSNGDQADMDGDDLVDDDGDTLFDEDQLDDFFHRTDDDGDTLWDEDGGGGDACDTDADGDGYLIWAEEHYGSDPADPGSTPEVCDGADNDGDTEVDEGYDYNGNTVPDCTDPNANTDGDGQANPDDDDDDNDGLPDSWENFMATDSLDACPDDASDPAWAPDMDNSRRITMGDVLMYRFVIGGQPGRWYYDRRFDLDADTNITIGDVLYYHSWIGQTCT